MEPCLNCPDPLYCNEMKTCIGEVMKAVFENPLREGGDELNDELSDLKEIDLIAEIHRIHERSTK